MKSATSAHIFLVGFMGSGKSTVGQVLARNLSRPFIDLDSVIESNTGRSIAEIFKESNESEFRRLELNAIQSCKTLEPSVIALGGGAFMAEANRRLVSEAGISVWLDCPLDVCLERIRGDKTRPLLGTDSEMQSLLKRRAPFYQQASLIVRTGGRTSEEIAAEIVKMTSLL